MVGSSTGAGVLGMRSWMGTSYRRTARTWYLQVPSDGVFNYRYPVSRYDGIVNIDFVQKYKSLGTLGLRYSAAKLPYLEKYILT